MREDSFKFLNAFKSQRMIYFQSILSLYETTAEEKQEIVVKQLVTFANTNKQHESFFQFLLDKMENTNALTPIASKSILNISIDFLNSQDPNFSVSNIKLYVQYLLKLLSLKTQPSSYTKYIDFLKNSFRQISQYNQETIFSSLSRIPFEQSIIPLSILCAQNSCFFSRVLSILDKSFSKFKKDQNLFIWTIAMTNLLLYTENDNKNDDNNSINKSISLILNKVFVNKFLSLDRKLNLLEAALHYMPPKLGDDLLSSHCINLLSSVTISSSIEEITIAVNFAKTVLIRLKENEIRNITSENLVDSVFTSILPSYRSDHLLNGSLTEFFNEVDQKYLQSKITSEMHSDTVSLSTLFLISRYPTQSTIPYLLTRARVDQKSQYILIFYFLAHNLVPFRYLPRLFQILEADDLHFLNEIFEQKPVLYCTAAIKFLSQCKNVQKIEYLSAFFSSAKSIPLIDSPYAQTAFIVVACLRAQSRVPGCPIRLLLDYLHACMNLSKSPSEEPQKDEQKKAEEAASNEAENEIEIEHQRGEVADDNDLDNESESQSKSDKKVEVIDKEEIEAAQVKISNESSQAEKSISASASSFSSYNDQIDLTNEDITSITTASNVRLYDIQKSCEELNRPTFCQSQAIHSMAVSDPERKESMINEALAQIKEGNAIFTIIIGSLSDDPILIHNCIQTLAQTDLFLLTFFFTTSASCSLELILKEIRDYINKEPEAAPQSFVARLFSSRPSTKPRRQRIARRCIIGMAPFISFSNSLYETLLASFPSDSESSSSSLITAPNSSSNSFSLTCESIIAVCSRLAMKEDLHLILQKVVAKANCFDIHLLIQALISILNANSVLSDKDASAVIKLWINLLLNSDKEVFTPSSNTKKNPEAFESVLLVNKNAKSIYLKEIELSISMNGDVPSLFNSLKRALPFISDFNLSKQPSFLTIVISNALSENETVLTFCVNILRSTFQMNSILNPIKGSVFSNEYIETVRHFFTELSGKFQSKQLVQLIEALLVYYKEKQPRHQASICLFTVFSILKQPQLFIQSKFISKIATACNKMTKKNDYAIIYYLFKCYDALNASNKTTFFNEFIAAPDNEFVNMYLEKYSCYYDYLEPLLIPKINQMKSIDDKWKSFIEFERLLKLLNGFVRLFVRDASSPSKISRIIFTLLLSVSTVNFIRKRGFAIDSYLATLENTFVEFKNLTGISLINQNNSKLTIKTDSDFYEFVSFFAQSFQYLQFDMVQFLLNSIESLMSTNHKDCALLCLSSFLVTVSNSMSDETKRLKKKSVDLFTSLLKNCKFDSYLLAFVVSHVPSAFSVTTLKQMDTNYLTIFLKLSFETAAKSSDCLPSLELVLNVIRSSTPSFIAPFVQQIIDMLRNVVSAGKIKLSSILVLNIIGEVGRRKQYPTCLLKDGSVSFRTLSPLLLSDENDIKTRVNAIFSLMIFGKAESDPDFELVFTSLMSLFVGYEKDSSNYVSIANDMLRAVDKLPNVTVKNLQLLKYVFQPVMSVGDQNCTEAISELLKYLKKLTASVTDDELFTLALSMMTTFAKPKRGAPYSSK